MNIIVFIHTGAFATPTITYLIQKTTFLRTLLAGGIMSAAITMRRLAVQDFTGRQEIWHITLITNIYSSDVASIPEETG
ncbi:hypothetical protein NUBL9661_26720 [Klebsiella pneumoniae]|nr:hypothetical protein NUBL9661_26720 [Klebsiella pneumoniae]GKN18072.1 hypothetical protein MS5380_41970 [Klebsiella pneumoniae]